MGDRPRALGPALVLVAASLVACAGPPIGHADAPSALALRYRARSTSAARPAVATRTYRAIASRVLSSRCRMLPHDSAAFDRVTRRCGIVRAVYTGAARLLLERAARPRFLEPLVLNGHLRWYAPVSSCH